MFYLKKSYSRLNEILYTNLIYGIGEIQNRFLSFPSVEFPTRITFPLLIRLYKAGVLRTNFIFKRDDFQDYDAKRLRTFLKQKFGFAADQIKRVDINNDRVIEISDEMKETLFIRMDKSRIRVFIIQDNRTIYTLIAKKDKNNHLKISDIEIPMDAKIIYRKGNADKLMRVIGLEFDDAYDRLEGLINELMQFKL